MPFASKFRAMMDFPFAGDTVGDFDVEYVDVRDRPLGSGRYTYLVRMVLRGTGGQQGVRRALKDLFSSHPITFSGYGNPYQLWFAKPEIESLGDKRYQVRIKGAGARVWLQGELDRFLNYLRESGQLAATPKGATLEPPVEAYLDGYRAEIARKLGRYRRRLRKAEQSGNCGG